MCAVVHALQSLQAHAQTLTRSNVSEFAERAVSDIALHASCEQLLCRAVLIATARHQLEHQRADATVAAKKRCDLSTCANTDTQAIEGKFNDGRENI